MISLQVRGSELQPSAISLSGNEGRPIRLRCPVCGQSDEALILRETDVKFVTCPACGFVLDQREGIWRALAPARGDRFQKFNSEYETIRRLEGRGSSDKQFYLELPYRDISGRNTWQWKIRGRSYRFFERRILSGIERHYPKGLDVLDIGAGNAWLSYRLALRGHRPVAVDLGVGALDGLGAAHHYFGNLPRALPLFQAEMDHLPFDDGQFDLVIFNAAFHYSEDYEPTLQEAARCLRRPGHLLIVDSPLYYRAESGLKMLKEQRQYFEKKYGFPSDSVASRGYLTSAMLDGLARKFGFKWKIYKPWYGSGWALRPLKAFLLRRREPSKFFIISATLTDR